MIEAQKLAYFSHQSKRVKTYLRSTMTDQRLNNLCLLAAEREMSHDLLSHPSSVIDKFALLRDRRLSLV